MAFDPLPKRREIILCTPAFFQDVLAFDPEVWHLEYKPAWSTTVLPMERGNKLHAQYLGWIKFDEPLGSDVSLH